MVERDLAKVEVAGSKPVSRSSFALAARELAVAGDGATCLNVSRGIDRARGAPTWSHWLDFAVVGDGATYLSVVRLERQTPEPLLSPPGEMVRPGM